MKTNGRWKKKGNTKVHLPDDPFSQERNNDHHS